MECNVVLQLVYNLWHDPIRLISPALDILIIHSFVVTIFRLHCCCYLAIYIVNCSHYAVQQNIVCISHTVILLPIWA